MKRDQRICLRLRALKISDSEDSQAGHGEKNPTLVLFMTEAKRQSCWVVDSEASSHMSHDRSVFISLSAESVSEVILADETAVKSADYG